MHMFALASPAAATDSRFAMKLKCVACALGFVMLAHGAAYAFDLPVSYLIDDRAFKDGDDSANALDFRLYSDPLCTVLIAEQAINAGDASVIFERATLRKISGVNDPVVKIVQVQAKFTGVGESTSSYYLVVSGAGIQPVGDSCQLQASTVLGPAGPTGPQ